MHTPFSRSMEQIHVHVTMTEDEMKGFDDLFQVHVRVHYTCTWKMVRYKNCTCNIPVTLYNLANICTKSWLPQCFWNFLTFPWPTELTTQIISPNNGLNPPLIASLSPIYKFYAFHKSHAVSDMNNIDSSLTWSARRKTHHQLVVQFHEQYSTKLNKTRLMCIKIKMYKKCKMLENNESRGKRIKMYS